jgi:hypothetical protein
MPRVVIEMRAPQANASTGPAQGAIESLSPDAVYAWRRAIQRQAEREASLRAFGATAPAPDSGRAPGAGGAERPPGWPAQSVAAAKAQQALVTASAEGIDEVLVSVERAVRAFRGEAEPADDATVLALRLGRRPPTG